MILPISHIPTHCPPLPLQAMPTHVCAMAHALLIHNLVPLHPLGSFPGYYNKSLLLQPPRHIKPQISR
eukprot:1154357-Pelagomonas_calceolata.AAC.3